MRTTWFVDKQYENVFPNSDSVAHLQGELISKSPLSRLIKVRLAETNVYVKSYNSPGRHFRKWFGRSRIKAEWQNLQLFASLGIKIPKIIAYGEQRSFGNYKQGWLIVDELVGCVDLSHFASDYPQQFNSETIRKMISQLANYTSKMHQAQFIHNDLKWRNILVRTKGEPVLYFIDCPIGRRRYGFQLKRGIIKDLACLDKKAKQHLSATQRLQFYFSYYGITTLSDYHKKQIRNILSFHQGRE